MVGVSNPGTTGVNPGMMGMVPGSPLGLGAGGRRVKNDDFALDDYNISATASIDEALQREIARRGSLAGKEQRTMLQLVVQD
jgi:hypothetical protein